MDNPIICRCEEITKQEVIEAIQNGARSVSAVKRYTRAGMGACQGRTCARLIEALLAQYGVEETKPDKPRFPLVPCKLGSLKEDA